MKYDSEKGGYQKFYSKENDYGTYYFLPKNITELEWEWEDIIIQWDNHEYADDFKQWIFVNGSNLTQLTTEDNNPQWNKINGQPSWSPYIVE